MPLELLFPGEFQILAYGIVVTWQAIQKKPNRFLIVDVCAEGGQAKAHRDVEGNIRLQIDMLLKLRIVNLTPDESELVAVSSV